MRYFFLFLNIIVIAFSANSQDLVVTQANDSIHCKINKISSTEIFYYYKAQQVVRPVTEIKSYVPQFYINNPEKLKEIEDRDFNQDTTEKEEPTKRNSDSERKVFLDFSFFGGYTHFISQTPSDIDPFLKEYLNELKSGRHFGGDLRLSLRSGWSFGLFYNIAQTSHSIDDVIFTNSNGVSKVGTLADDINISYTGVIAAKRFNFGNFLSLEVYTGMGYMSYVNHVIMLDRYTFRGGTLGQTMGGSFGVKVSERVLIEIKTSYKSGAISSFTVEDESGVKEKITLEEDEYEGISRLDLSLGIRFKL